MIKERMIKCQEFAVVLIMQRTHKYIPKKQIENTISSMKTFSNGYGRPGVINNAKPTTIQESTSMAIASIFMTAAFFSLFFLITMDFIKKKKERKKNVIITHTATQEQMLSRSIFIFSMVLLYYTI